MVTQMQKFRELNLKGLINCMLQKREQEKNYQVIWTIIEEHN